MEIKKLNKLFFSFAAALKFKKSVLLLGFFMLPFLGFNQATVVVSAIDNIAAEGNPTSDTGLFQIDLGTLNTTGTSVTVNFVLGGTATTGVDYENFGNTVVIANGARTAQIVVTAINDSDIEGNESIALRLTGTSNPAFTVAGNASSNASIILVDDDGCSSGNLAPVLNSPIETRYCSDFEVDLSGFISSATPIGTTLEWSSNPNPNPNDEASFLQSSIITTGGDYYGFYYGTFNGTPCISPVVAIPTITFDVKPLLGTPNNNNQACNRFLSGNFSLDLDNTLDGETAGGFWNLIDAPNGESTSIDGNNRVSYLNEPAGEYVYTYTPNYASAPSCTPESIEVVVFVTDCALNCDAGNRPPERNTAIPTTVCVDENNNTVDLSDYTSTPAPTGTTLIWSRNSDFNRADAYLDSTIIGQTATYYAFFLDEENNCASPYLAVSIIFITKPEILEFTENALCNEGIMTLSATATSGSVINWYGSLTSTTPLEKNSANFTTPNLTTSTTYYVEAVLNGCASDRQAVIATINNDPIVQATSTPIEACNIVGADVSNLIDLFSGLTQDVSGTWVLSSGPSTSVVITTEGFVDFEGLPLGNYTFTFTTNTAVAPCSETSALVTVRVIECIIDSDGDGLSDEYEISIGTNPNNQDSDNDGILDGDEVGDDIANPLDGDGDGIIDALDSNTLDTDMDGVVDQLDPANTNPCIPDNTVGMCDTDGDGISDGIEIANGSDPLDPCDPNLTPDCAPDPIDLQIIKTVDNLRPVVDDEILFTISLTNLSANRVVSIIVNELLTTARGFEYVSHTVTNGQYNSGLGTWNIEEMQANEEYILTITAKVLEFGDFTNTAEITSSFPIDAVEENNISSITLDVISRNIQDCGFMYNQFSPNGDGINDFLVVNCIENYPNNTLEIFDRYGNQVYKAANYDNLWDGTGKNGAVPKGTYYYVLNLGLRSDLPDSEAPPVQRGWIQIIR